MGLDFLVIFLNIIVVVQTITAAVMCVYGCKWSRGLIATMALYIGAFLGLFISVIAIEGTGEIDAIILLPIIVVVFWVSAYKVIWLNHFLAGFLLVTKLSYMIIFALMKNDVMEADLGILLGASLALGFIAGIIISAAYNNYVLLLCVAFIGATELGTKICAFIDKGLFFVTGDIGYIGLDPESIMFKLFGIDNLGFKEVAIIIVIFVISFLWQKQVMIDNGIDLSAAIVDDRKLKS